MTFASCVPADPQSKGGSEATVRIASADVVPTDANLLPEYSSFAEYRRACDHFCDEVNARPHRVTRCPPIERLAQERERLHPLPAQPYTAAFGVGRKVGEIVPVIQFDGGEYSVPDDYVSQEVWVRQQDDEIIIVHVGRDGPHDENHRWPFRSRAAAKPHTSGDFTPGVGSALRVPVRWTPECEDTQQHHQAGSLGTEHQTSQQRALLRFLLDRPPRSVDGQTHRNRP